MFIALCIYFYVYYVFCVFSFFNFIFPFGFFISFSVYLCLFSFLCFLFSLYRFEIAVLPCYRFGCFTLLTLRKWLGVSRFVLYLLKYMNQSPVLRKTFRVSGGAQSG